MLLCLAATACGREASSCPAPTNDGLRADRQKSAFVARVVVTGKTRLEQGPTLSEGYLLRTDSTLVGEEPPREFALWPALDAADLREGTTYVVFARTSLSGQDGPVTANGAPVTAFHVAVPGGVFEVDGDRIARACRDGNSERVGDDVLTGI
ncbi:hypothetical protein [Lentzea albida]|uniref:Uncharacterized protein n=1 Tax=Lentzea albida TaxID=65499 RepID=A0A1H9GJI5_9PSEU|nr:hypothetical protein [Lentzea albida]SEQ50255.1 hypothetical protein SAMN04488000_103153 [Lentzea albida]